jgi:hypothetical protein
LGALRLLLAAPGAPGAANEPTAGVEGSDAVVSAAKANHLNCLDALLSVGCSPDVVRTSDGESAIMVTARFESHLPCSKVWRSTPAFDVAAVLPLVNK